MATDWMLIDGSSLMFRAFFGIPTTVKSPKGEPVNAVRGFLDMLARLIGDRKPHAMVVATDEDWRPAFRVALLPSYKAHRVAEPIPPELIPQVSVIEKVLSAVGIETVGAEGFEAEDIIASLLPKLRGKVEIVTGDRDLFALVRDPDVQVLYTQQGIGKIQVVDEAEIERRYGIPGRAYGDFAVLRGDPSDGLPGVSGIGEKTASQLLRRYGGLDGLIASGRLDANAIAYVAKARQAGVPVDRAPVAVPRGEPTSIPEDQARLDQLTKEYGIAAPVERLVQALRGQAERRSVTVKG
jgi:5'-3' exonuclease